MRFLLSQKHAPACSARELGAIRNMPKKKTPIEKAAGKLISAIQKEWGKELGESTTEVNEDVIGKGHNLLKAAKNDEVTSVLRGLSVAQYLGELWVRRHPKVIEYITAFEKELELSGKV